MPLICILFSQNSELFTLTYGTLVSQLLKDYENVDEVNKQLERMGYNIGVRLIEDFLARTGSGRCYDFKDTAEKIQVSFLLLFLEKNFSVCLTQLICNYLRYHLLSEKECGCTMNSTLALKRTYLFNSL